MTGSTELYRALLPFARSRRFRRNQQVFERGDEPLNAILVLAGEVEMFVESRGRRTLLDRRRSGGLLGVLSLLSGVPHIASAIATEASSLGLVRRGDFERCIQANPELRDMLLRESVQLIEQLMERVLTVQLDAYGRLRHSLLEMACAGPDGLEILGRWTQRDLAEHAGCTRETASKIIRALRNGGWLRCERDRLVVLRPLPDSF